MEPDGVIESNWSEITDNFDDMNLKETLLRGIYAYGFEKPSAIQQRAIIPCIKGYDVIAQAQSGTGKTATFVPFLSCSSWRLNRRRLRLWCWLPPESWLSRSRRSFWLWVTTWGQLAMPASEGPISVVKYRSSRLRPLT